MKKILTKFKAILALAFLSFLVGCNPFHGHVLLQSFGYKIDECDQRDRVIHYSYEPDGSTPPRATISSRKFRCRIERICIGKSEIENEECRKAARSYWGFDEREKNWNYFKDFDDSWDAICTLNKNPWNPNFKDCSPKWHSQENYETNPYWNKETKSYILPEVVKSHKDQKTK